MAILPTKVEHYYSVFCFPISYYAISVWHRMVFLVVHKLIERGNIKIQVVIISHRYRFFVLYKCQNRLAQTVNLVPYVAIAGGSIGTELCILLSAIFLILHHDAFSFFIICLKS